MLLITLSLSCRVNAQTIKAGTGKSNITIDGAFVNDSLYAKALVLQSRDTKLVILTMDVLSIGRSTSFTIQALSDLRNMIRKEYGIDGEKVLINASHNHCGGKVPEDIAMRAFMAVRKAFNNLEPVKIGSGTGSENRISMNRRVKLSDGKVFTIRQASPNMPDEMITGVGETDNEIGILRIDRMDGSVKAVVYNFACHPYTGVPNGGITAEYPGFASGVIENNAGNSSMAFFLQGAAGDITEILYKDVNNVRDCRPFGEMLGLSTVQALKSIPVNKAGKLSIISDTVMLPLRSDIPEVLRILEEDEEKLLSSLRSTSLNIKSFIPLYIKYSLSPDYPSYYSYRYFQEEKTGVNDLNLMDELNRKNMDKYLDNILAMEKLAQIREDKAMLNYSLDEINKYGGSFVAAEILAVRIGDFIIITFPAEMCVNAGLRLKELSPFKQTFISAYTNGYLNYAPAAEEYIQGGYEYTRAIFKPEWQNIYETRILSIISRL